MPIRELQCPDCQNVGRFRVNAKNQIISSCANCGWKPGAKHSIQNRYVVMETVKDDGTKIRRLVK